MDGVLAAASRRIGEGFVIRTASGEQIVVRLDLAPRSNYRLLRVHAPDGAEIYRVGGTNEPPVPACIQPQPREATR
ncbi:MAG: hypothetical protein AB7U73_01125 [Pirellulales bacterium]